MRKPFCDYVEGAPIQAGTLVRIGEGTDETFDESFAGKSGVVAHLEYDCRCSQTFPNDPMIGVRFDDGQVEEFWFEELILS